MKKGNSTLPIRYVLVLLMTLYQKMAEMSKIRVAVLEETMPIYVAWTPVVGKKKKRSVPDFIERRFPPDHPVRTSNSSESDGDSTSEEDLNTVVPTGANVDVQFKMVDNTPGLTVRTRSTRSWTPIATRTRARMKK